jgi:hypothetical protein
MYNAGVSLEINATPNIPHCPLNNPNNFGRNKPERKGLHKFGSCESLEVNLLKYIPKKCQTFILFIV